VAINKNIKKNVFLSLIIAIGVSMNSCDYIKVENQNYLHNNEAITERVKVNIEEAKVISDISILNETIIALSSLSLEKNSTSRVKKIAYKLKKDSIEIKKYLNDLADKKLILLPNGLDEEEINKLSEIDKASFSEAYLKKIGELSNITNDLDFKVLTVKTVVKLNYNLSQVNKTLK
jgi:hypothetical protein